MTIFSICRRCHHSCRRRVITTKESVSTCPNRTRVFKRIYSYMHCYELFVQSESRRPTKFLPELTGNQGSTRHSKFERNDRLVPAHVQFNDFYMWRLQCVPRLLRGNTNYVRSPHSPQKAFELCLGLDKRFERRCDKTKLSL